MKLFKIFILTAVIGLIPFKSAQAVDPKLKVLMTTAAYGTVGGALLGTASLAFGTSSRAVFQGASIGLWTGLIFGSYIVYSHQNRPASNTDGQYPENEDSPYQEEEYDDGGGGTYDSGYRWNPYTAFGEIETKNILKESRKLGLPENGVDDKLPVYLNLLDLSF